MIRPQGTASSTPSMPCSTSMVCFTCRASTPYEQQLLHQAARVLAEVDPGEIVRAVEHLVNQRHRSDPVLAFAQQLLCLGLGMRAVCRRKRLEVIWRLFLTRCGSP